MGNIYITKTLMPERADFDQYVDQIFSSTQVTNNGPLVQQLEKKLEKYLDVKHVVLVSNGTMALQIAYKLLRLTGEVVTSPFSFIATSSSLVWSGLDVKFADIDEQTLNINPEKIKGKISPKTSAIVPVHVFGNPCEVDEIQKIADQHDLKVIYDASHCFGVKYKGESILNRGDISTISFHATKLFHTIEGGALIINDDDLCEQARNMINFGITGQEQIDCLGINGKLSEFQAAMGLCLLGKVDGAIEKRKIISECYDEVISEKFIYQRYHSYGEKNYIYYPIIFQDESSLLHVQKILNEKGIYPRRYFYTPLNELRFLSEKQDAPVTELMSKKILCLPLSADLSIEDCFSIAKLVYFNTEEIIDSGDSENRNKTSGEMSAGKESV